MVDVATDIKRRRPVSTETAYSLRACRSLLESCFLPHRSWNRFFPACLSEEPLVPFTALISRTNPTALVFLLDQSCPMLEPFAGQPNKSKAAGVADGLNHLLQNLVLKCVEHPDAVADHCG
jgi:hypothetical protein